MICGGQGLKAGRARIAGRPERGLAAVRSHRAQSTRPRRAGAWQVRKGSVSTCATGARWRRTRPCATGPGLAAAGQAIDHQLEYLLSETNSGARRWGQYDGREPTQMTPEEVLEYLAAQARKRASRRCDPAGERAGVRPRRRVRRADHGHHESWTRPGSCGLYRTANARDFVGQFGADADRLHCYPAATLTIRASFGGVFGQDSSGPIDEGADLGAP